MIKIAVLVSGSGSNLQALIDAKLSGQIVGVLSNRPDAYALERAKQAGIKTALVEHKQYPSGKHLMMLCISSCLTGELIWSC